ncbi:MAG TPA: hypothetical protein VGO89_10985, partial [Streptomyces sp.]|nr:hypothetical protein [Streptomyces sp.]
MHDSLQPRARLQAARPGRLIPGSRADFSAPSRPPTPCDTNFRIRLFISTILVDVILSLPPRFARPRRMKVVDTTRNSTDWTDFL